MLLSLDQTIYAHVTPISPILEKGIAMADMDRFCGTDTGAEFLRGNSIFIEIPASSAIYIPAGWASHLVYTDSQDNPKNRPCQLLVF